MPSQPEESVDQDLRHIVQYVRLARTPLLEEVERSEYLTEIENRAHAAMHKLASQRPLPAEPMPEEYLLGRGGPLKLLRFYWCMGCGLNHWEDDRPKYDDHILHAGRIEYGRRHVELVR